MMPPKRPREKACIGGDEDDSALVIPPPPPEQRAEGGVAVAAVAAAGQEDTATPSKSVRLNLTKEESAEEECKSLGAIVAESSSVAGFVTPALVRLHRKRAAKAKASTSVAESEDEKEQGTSINATTATTASISDQPMEYESSGARRSLFPTPAEAAATASTATATPAVVEEVTAGHKRPHHAATITPSLQRGCFTLGPLVGVPAAKRKLIFGRLVTETTVQENVRHVYRIIRKFTGGIGGNGSHGPIYGELTMGSMQKMVNLMKEHAGLSCSSRFIDVGSGIGKPNFHVAQDPGVEFSYGIEIEADRWLLGMSCLKQVLNVVASQQEQEQLAPTMLPSESLLQHRVLFEHGDIRNAKTFDPFTHVYMFSIGFPPQLWITLSEIWNQSTSPYMICFHSPKDVIKSYEFDVELVTQMPTSMHGSKEGHTGYIYRRRNNKSLATTVVHEAGRECCDPLFHLAQEKVKCGFHAIKAEVDAKVEEKMNNRTKRVPGKKMTAT